MKYFVSYTHHSGGSNTLFGNAEIECGHISGLAALTQSVERQTGAQGITILFFQRLDEGHYYGFKMS